MKKLTFKFQNLNVFFHKLKERIRSLSMWSAKGNYDV